jgi:hypothetical protein
MHHTITVLLAFSYLSRVRAEWSQRSRYGQKRCVKLRERRSAGRTRTRTAEIDSGESTTATCSAVAGCITASRIPITDLRSQLTWPASETQCLIRCRVEIPAESMVSARTEKEGQGTYHRLTGTTNVRAPLLVENKHRSARVAGEEEERGRPQMVGSPDPVCARASTCKCCQYRAGCRSWDGRSPYYCGERDDVKRDAIRAPSVRGEMSARSRGGRTTD